MMLGYKSHSHSQGVATQREPIRVIGKFEITEDGLFSICRTGPSVKTAVPSDTSSTRAEISTTPDTTSIPLEDSAWDDDVSTSVPSYIDLEFDLVLGAGCCQAECPEATVTELGIMSWRVESVTLDDFDQELDLEWEVLLPTSTITPKSASKRDTIKWHMHNSVPSWIYNQNGAHSIAGSSESAPDLTGGSSGESESIPFSQHASGPEEDITLESVELYPNEAIEISSENAEFILVDLTHPAYARCRRDATPHTPESALQHPVLPKPVSGATYDVHAIHHDNGEDFASDSLGDTASDSDTESVWMSDYSEGVPVLDSGHPFLQIKGQVVINALLAFDNWPSRYKDSDGPPKDGTGTAGGGSSAVGTSATSPPRGSWQSSGRKRSRKSSGNPEDGEDGEDGREPPKKRNRKAKRPTRRQVSLACPFTKKNPIKYRDCYSLLLRRTNHVKQHLSRCHQLPLYCQRCKELFSTEDERDHHGMTTMCEARSDITYEGVTRAQKEQLTQRVSARMTLEDQWFTIFDILFPGHTPRPTSAFTNTALTIDLETFQDMMLGDGPSIILSTLQTHGIRLSTSTNQEHDLSALLRVVLSEGLHRIAQRWTSTLVDANIPGGPGSHSDGSGMSETSQVNANTRDSRASSDTLVETRATGPQSVSRLESLFEETGTEQTPGRPGINAAEDGVLVPTGSLGNLDTATAGANMATGDPTGHGTSSSETPQGDDIADRGTESASTHVQSSEGQELSEVSCCGEFNDFITKFLEDNPHTEDWHMS
jgi:hypothetical protein